MFKFPFLNKKFVFSEYLLSNGYFETVNDVRMGVGYYQNNDFIIIVRYNDGFGYDMVHVLYKSVEVAKFNFIPNSKLLADMILKNVTNSINELELMNKEVNI